MKWGFYKKKICTDELKKKIKDYKEALLRTNEDFQKGRVKKYTLGTAPDIIARNQNIYVTDDNINNNGVYFFQAPGKINGEKNGKKLRWIGIMLMSKTLNPESCIKNWKKF